MKEIQLNQKEKTELSIKKEQKKQQELIERMRPHPGHKIWEIDFKNQTVKEAEYESVDVKMSVTGDMPTGTNRKIVVKPMCSYISALNKKSAVKKFFKGETGSKQYGSLPPMRLLAGKFK